MRRPYIGHEVTVADSREGDHHEVSGLEQVEVAVPGALEVLDAAHAETEAGPSYQPLYLFAKLVQNFKSTLFNSPIGSTSSTSIC